MPCTLALHGIMQECPLSLLLLHVAAVLPMTQKRLNLLLLLRAAAVLPHGAGLANPGPIVSSFYMDENLPDRVRLDGIVTVVSLGLRFQGSGLRAWAEWV